jgi:hypothetical protein
MTLGSCTGTIPQHLRERAARALARVYPPEVCRELLLKRWYGWIVYPLFQGHLPLDVVPRLQLGLDLDTVQPWDDTELLNRLRNREHYNGAAFELSVWANLIRAGYQVQRTPQGPKRKLPDFAVIFDHRRYVLELKDLELGDLDVLAEEVQQIFYSGAVDVTVPARAVTLLPSSSFCDTCLSDAGRKKIRESLDALAVAFLMKLLELERSGFEPGTYAVEPYGRIQIELQEQFPHGTFACRLVPETSAWRSTKRIVNEIAHASKQLPDNALGVVVINPRSFTQLEELGAELARKEAEKPSRFRNCAFVVVKLRDRQGKDGPPLPRVALYPMQRHAITEAEHRFVRTLTYDASGSDRELPSRTRLIGLGKITAESGVKSLSITFSGNGNVAVREEKGSPSAALPSEE